MEPNGLSITSGGTRIHVDANTLKDYYVMKLNTYAIASGCSVFSYK
jgi:hypothetical protein